MKRKPRGSQLANSGDMSMEFLLFGVLIGLCLAGIFFDIGPRIGLGYLDIAALFR